MSDSGILIRNLVLSILCLALAAYGASKGSDSTVAAALSFVTGLWLHSGRRRKPREPGMGAGPGVALPVACMAFLCFSGCRGEGGGVMAEMGVRVVRGGAAAPASVAPLYGPQAKLIADSIEFTSAAVPTYTSGRGGIHLLNTDGLFYTQDANGLLLKLHAAQSFRTSANCSGLSSPAVGDVCYDTGLGTFRFYDASGWESTPEDDLVVHLAGNETITGTKTFNAGPVFAAGATASGATAFNLGGSSATFTTPTGTNTLSGNVAIPTTKTVTVGANVLIGSVADKLNAAYLAIASQATGDLLVADSASTFARKAIGTNGQVLAVVSGAVAWASLPYTTISGGGTGALGAATVYLTAPGQTASATERFLSLVTRASTSKNLYCFLGTAPGGADTVAVTVRENASDQALTCTITGAGTTCNDTSNSFASVAGDRLSVKAVSTAGTAADITCTFEVLP